MVAQRKYPDELRERAVGMVLEIRKRDGKGRGVSRSSRKRGPAVRDRFSYPPVEIPVLRDRDS